MTINLEGAEVRPIEADAHAVLLPEVDSVQIDDWVDAFMRRGGRALLLTLTAEECGARRVDEARRRREDTSAVQLFCSRVTAAANTTVIVASDAESGGVQRFEHLLPPMPNSASAVHLTDTELADAYQSYAEEARRLGVTMFLGPVVDMVTGINPWLSGRLLIDDFTRTASTAAIYVREVQRAGIAAAAKYFPGHSDLPQHPAQASATLTIDQDDVVRNLAPFQHLVDEGVRAIVLGPVTVSAIDPGSPAATSRVLVDLLRRELGFRGLIISDQLNVPSTALGRNLGQVAHGAIAAGVQLLRIPGGAKVSEVAAGLAQAVHDGRLSRSQLSRAADAVRATASALCWAPSAPLV
jgi:beta-N-acetylhexosaminidase